MNEDSALSLASGGERRDTEAAMHRGELFILSAPSGTGKTTLIHSLLGGGLGQIGGIYFSVSYTTRQPRQGEVDGQDYHFVSRKTFGDMILREQFLEWAEVHNHYYGTAYDEVIPHLEKGIDVLMDIDVQGAERLLGHNHEESNDALAAGGHSIFIMPPTYLDLKGRLETRNLDDPADIAQRLAVSVWEMKRYVQYDYVIINDDAERASQILESIILEKRHRRERMRQQVTTILQEFSSATS